jgi:OFA family oxalate/formate antiporter-like MFS transporter
MVAGLGAMYGVLPLVYLGYGAAGGIGWGLGYISPVSTLMKYGPNSEPLC